MYINAVTTVAQSVYTCLKMPTPLVNCTVNVLHAMPDVQQALLQFINVMH